MGPAGPAAAEAVRVSGVSCRYPGADRDILRDISLTVPQGQFLSIVGPSGGGKTTLLNCIAGFVTPSAGLITVGGAKVDGVIAGRAAFMFARDALLPWRSALGNVELAIRIRERRKGSAARAAGREILSEARALLARVGLRGHEDYMIDELSQGMRQRVALARTLAVAAPLILMDEPFGALDAQTRAIMQNEFLSLWEKERRSVVLITHDVAEAIMMSDRIIVLGGRPAGIIADIAVDLPRPRDAAVIHGAGSDLFRDVWSKLEFASSQSGVAASRDPS